MTTAAAAPEPVFVDTNVLVYAAVPAFPLHADSLARLNELVSVGAPLWISRQTLREYLSALSRPVGDFRRFTAWIDILPLVANP